MKKYEGMFLVDSKEHKKSGETLEEAIKNLVAKCDGEVVRLEKWDDRRLAYEIKGATNGTYFLTYLTGEQDTIQRLNREIELSPVVLRALFLAIKEIPEPPNEEDFEPTSEATETSEDKTDEAPAAETPASGTTADAEAEKAGGDDQAEEAASTEEAEEAPAEAPVAESPASEADAAEPATDAEEDAPKTE